MKFGTPKEQWREGCVPRRGRTRRHQHPVAVLSWPMWKRALCFLLFVVGGGGAAAWGVNDLLAWIVALHRSNGMIETENFILGFPLLGAGLCAIGLEFITPRWLATWSEAGKTRFAAVVLGSVGAGILFVSLGQLVITMTMELKGYHACEVEARGRIMEVTWAGAAVACGGKSPVR
ncbi:MAG: hypothetical protein EOO40_04375 [Deltaproteobacteria bacterium]|nr:MAG: hypothetical protein EOO40_04375 [Deltaproteobacteria bacterium]